MSKSNPTDISPEDAALAYLQLRPEDIIKLASNENPLGPSPKAVEAMKKAVEEVHIYPDGASWKLRNALAGGHTEVMAAGRADLEALLQGLLEEEL